jgi:hypothetical protein
VSACVRAVFGDNSGNRALWVPALWVLDILEPTAAKYRKIGENGPVSLKSQIVDKFMTLSRSSQSHQKKVSPERCKHPQVQIVSRDEETEYVECQECGDVFESSEFRDMAIEEKKEPDEE